LHPDFKFMSGKRDSGESSSSSSRSSSDDEDTVSARQVDSIALSKQQILKEQAILEKLEKANSTLLSMSMTSPRANSAMTEAGIVPGVDAPRLQASAVDVDQILRAPVVMPPKSASGTAAASVPISPVAIYAGGGTNSAQAAPAVASQYELALPPPPPPVDDAPPPFPMDLARRL
jgi:hypothetical protein